MPDKPGVNRQIGSELSWMELNGCCKINWVGSWWLIAFEMVTTWWISHLRARSKDEEIYNYEESPNKSNQCIQDLCLTFFLNTHGNNNWFVISLISMSSVLHIEVLKWIGVIWTGLQIDWVMNYLMIGLTAWLTAIDKGAWRLEIQSGSGSREETAKAQVDGNATVAFLDLYDLNVWDVYQLLKKGVVWDWLQRWHIINLQPQSCVHATNPNRTSINHIPPRSSKIHIIVPIWIQLQ